MKAQLPFLPFELLLTFRKSDCITNFCPKHHELDQQLLAEVYLRPCQQVEKL